MREFTGYVEFYYEMNDRPAQVERLLEAITHADEAMLTIIADSPADLIGHDGNFDSTLMPPPVYRRFFLPFFQRLCDVAHRRGKVVVTPCQGRSEPTGGMVLLNDWYDIPYGCLLPRDVRGLIVGSGKTVSCRPRAAVRGMSRCMPIGHAAGVAAALAAKQGVSPHEVDVREVQRVLLEQNAFLGDDARLRGLGL